ncbi:hypothetical protein O3M35_004884 [Rhynocoris fuscipes]|uniref:Tetratricopeptide repeat protein 25 n=1 Tax=Rhynocoris fuscipes TaxID=488301 RepID=A0AAW1DNE9_9HEMI
MALKAYEKQWYETAINLFDIAENVHDTGEYELKMPLCIYKSKTHRALANMEDSRYEALKALKFNRENSTSPHLNYAHLLYHENEFEEALQKFVKSNDGTLEFERGINLVMGTLSNCVGRNAGDMFDAEVVGQAVEVMKREQLGLPLPPKFDDSSARENILKIRRRYLAGRYLGEVAKDKDFLEKLQNKATFKGASQDLKQTIDELLETALDKLFKKQEAMWHRKPLYCFYAKVRDFQSSEYAKKFEAHKRALDKAMLEKVLMKQVKELVAFKNNNQYVKCYARMFRLRNRLKMIDPRMLPRKIDYLNRIMEIMGEMYLSSKRLLPKLSDEMNDLRIKCFLGVYRQHWPTSLAEVNHVDVKHEESLKKRFEAELEIAKDCREKAFFHYEIACIIGMKYEAGGDMRGHCFAAYEASKKCNNIAWFLNSILLIVRSTLADNRFEEGLLTLIAAREACNNYHHQKQVKFLDRAILLMQHLKPEDFLVKKSSLVAEEKVIRLMPTSELKSSAAQFIVNLSSFPAWRRMTLPGAGSLKDRAKEIKFLRPLPKEKTDETELIVHRDDWVAGLDDTEPYTVKDIWSKEKKKQLLTTVYTEPRYKQFLSIEGESVDNESKPTT